MVRNYTSPAVLPTTLISLGLILHTEQVINITNLKVHFENYSFYYFAIWFTITLCPAV